MRCRYAQAKRRVVSLEARYSRLQLAHRSLVLLLPTRQRSRLRGYILVNLRARGERDGRVSAAPGAGEESQNRWGKTNAPLTLPPQSDAPNRVRPPPLPAFAQNGRNLLSRG